MCGCCCGFIVNLWLYVKLKKNSARGFVPDGALLEWRTHFLFACFIKHEGSGLLH